MEVISQQRRRGAVIPPPSDFDGGSRNSWSSFPISSAYLGIGILLTAIFMLFAGLVSAYFVLRGLPQWQYITVPRLAWANTVVLIASSIAFEFARAAVRRNQSGTMLQWLGTGGVLGLGFLVGQFLVWRQLVRAGVYLATTIHSSFFYVLTGAHALHLAGGMVGLAVVLRKALAKQLTADNHEALGVFAVYWHFMDVIWISCFLLLLLA
jgi:cytochrome c oxidase subunit 3